MDFLLFYFLCISCYCLSLFQWFFILQFVCVLLLFFYCFWTPELAVVYCICSSVRPFVCPSLCSFATQDLSIGSSVFSYFFCTHLEIHKVNFCKKALGGHKDSKSPKNGLKMRLLGFWQKSNPFQCSFFTLLLKY